MGVWPPRQFRSYSESESPYQTSIHLLRSRHTIFTRVRKVEYFEAPGRRGLKGLTSGHWASRSPILRKILLSDFDPLNGGSGRRNKSTLAHGEPRLTPSPQLPHLPTHIFLVYHYENSQERNEERGEGQGGQGVGDLVGVED